MSVPDEYQANKELLELRNHLAEAGYETTPGRLLAVLALAHVEGGDGCFVCGIESDMSLSSLCFKCFLRLIQE